MHYSKLMPLMGRREVISAFGGYDHHLRCPDGSFYDMTNMTGDDYPLLSSRPRRGFLTGGGDIRCLLAKDQLCYADGGDLVIGSTHISLNLQPGDTRLISMGAYIVILPDGVYVNTADPTDRGRLEASFTAAQATVRLCHEDGSDLKLCADPEHPADGDYRMAGSLQRWSQTASAWVGEETTFVKLMAEGIGRDFREGDGVRLTGVPQVGSTAIVLSKNVDFLVMTGFLIRDKLSTIVENASLTGDSGQDKLSTIVENTSLTGDSGQDKLSTIVENTSLTGDSGQDKLSTIVENTSLTEQTLTDIAVERRIPKMDFCVEAGNRLWGCRYGPDREGRFVNELYASKLGDFTNWECFAGLSTDSYRVSLGSDGVFTGAVTYLGYPMFFKEGQLHRVYGSAPMNFQIQSDACQGVQKGSGRSLAVVGETLYYKSRLGVCAYDGTLPVEVSAALGEKRYHSAVAGAHGGKYYICMADENGAWHFFVYDTRRRFWHRQDGTRVLSFASWGSDLYFLDAADGCIHTVFGEGSGNVEKSVSWMVQTGLIGAREPDRKYLSRLQLRLRLALDSVADVYVMYDSSGVWEYAGSVKGTGLAAREIPIRPRRCDHLRLKLEGRGAVTVFSLAKTMSGGG